MEIKFQNPRNLDFFARKSKPTRNKSCKKNKFLGVRQRPSGKWVAEIKNTTQKIRMWLGTFDTAEEAARAYDEAACLLRGSNTRKNFVDHCPPNSNISLKIKTLFNQKKASKQNLTFIPKKSSTKTTKKTYSPATSHVLPIEFNQGFNIIHDELLDYNFSFQLPKPTIETSTTMSSQTTSHQSYSGTTSPSTTSDYSNQDFHIFDDDAYKPNLSQSFQHEGNRIEPYQFGQAFGDDLYELLSTTEDFLVPKSEDRLPEFEHMKVERQISASLYAMNGINEYWENFNNFNDSLLDLPMVSHMFCYS